MAKKANMSIGNIINTIPTVRRKHKSTTRLDLVRKALNKAQAGQVLPIYMGSTFGANSLATLLRKSLGPSIQRVAVRKHIVYVQKQGELQTTEPTVVQAPATTVDVTAAV